jgi:signal transduction histidine kinase
MLALLLIAAPAIAQEQWRTRTGDDQRWSQPQLDGASWRPADIRSTWQQQAYARYDGMIWFRGVVTLPADARSAASSNDLGVLLGPPAYGGYEVFANGRDIGRSRGWSPPLGFGFAEVFRVPRDAIAKDGTLRLALRVRRIGWLSDADAEAAAVSGTLTVGSYRALSDHVRVGWNGLLLRELPLLVLAALFAFTGLHHLLLFGRRRKETEHLWFGLLALAFAVNTFASSYWIYELTANRGLATRISDLTGHLAAVFAIQFLWTFFSRRISWRLRAYQLSHLALALFVGFWPDLRAVFASATARWLWLLPLLAIAAILVLREIRRGHAEARMIAAGGAIMILIQAAELARNVVPLHWPFDFPVAAFGFGAATAAMSLALSLRFRRVHEELDRLRFRLEDEVLERTRDLAEARDEALAANGAKSEFLANISHEIRTPLNGVIGMAELLGCSSLTPDQRRQLDVIQSSGRALLTLLNEVLDFSRLDAKTLSVEHQPFRPADVVEECVDIMAPLAAGKGIVLTSSVAGGAARRIVSDPHRTRQVLLNLLSNAIKFTRRGRVEVAMSSRALDDGRVEVRFAIRDTGPGIAANDLARLFVAFQQLDGSSSREHGGAGLGLAISKRLTELMGGTIGVDSSPGRGSTFHFTIVGEAAADASRPLPVTPAPSLQPSVSPLRILLAEDDAVNRLVVLGMLEQLGYRAAAVGSGTEVLETLEGGPCDVILLDVQMPGMDGLAVSRRIRAGTGEQPHIIAITAHALAGDRERCLAAGMNDYVSKPLTLAALRNALARAGVTPAA